MMKKGKDGPNVAGLLPKGSAKSPGCEKYKTAYNQITDIQQVYNEQSQQLTEVKERIEQLHNELKDEQPDYEAI